MCRPHYVRAVSVSQLIVRPWLHRVVQEAALASRSICHWGSYTIPLCLIQRVALWLYSQSKSSQSALSGHTGLARAVHLASYTDELFEKPFRTENNLLWMLNTLKQYDTSRGEDHVCKSACPYRVGKATLCATHSSHARSSDLQKNGWPMVISCTPSGTC